MGVRTGLMSLLAVLAVHVAPAAARSTAAARFSVDAIAGPGIDHRVELYVHHFPGDGEAVLRLELTGNPETVRLREARSSLGRATAASGAVQVDYTAAPIASECVDTLDLELTWVGDAAKHEWSLAVYSTLDNRGDKPAHRSTVSMGMQAPVVVQVAPYPAQVFAGEEVRLALAVRNQDPQGRDVTRLRVEWPPGISGGVDTLRAAFSPPLSAGQSDTVRHPVQFADTLNGWLTLPVRVDAAQVAGSQAGPVSLEVLPLPTVRLDAPEDGMRMGQQATVACEWINTSGRQMELAAVRLQIGPGFTGVRAAGDGSNNARARIATAGSGAARIEVPEIGSLGPDERIRIEVETVPQRVGLHYWRAFARPAGRDRYIELSGNTTLMVTLPADSAAGIQPEPAVQDDLEAIQAAIQSALLEGALDLPVRAGAAIELVAGDPGSGDWVVADVLTAALMEQGYQVVLEAQDRPSRSMPTLLYRIVDARVIYSPSGSGWHFWRRGLEREAFADVLLHLKEADGALVWARRVRAYATDHLSTGGLEKAGSGELVARTVVERDNSIVERGLSAGIIGGLVYIFFVL